MTNKNIFEPEHYTLNEATGEISFATDHKHYKLERLVFARNGINIDTVKDIEKYLDLITEYRHEISQEFHDQWRKVNPKTLSKKLTKSLILNDEDESARISNLIDKKNTLNLRIVK